LRGSHGASSVEQGAAATGNGSFNSATEPRAKQKAFAQFNTQTYKTAARSPAYRSP